MKARTAIAAPARRAADRGWLRRPGRPRHHHGLHHAARRGGGREHAGLGAERQFRHRPGPRSRPRPVASGRRHASPSPVPVSGPVRVRHPSATPVPVGAPATGGGGAAGVQDVLLFGLGGVALLAGAGSLAYRRRALRDR